VNRKGFWVTGLLCCAVVAMLNGRRRARVEKAFQRHTSAILHGRSDAYLDRYLKEVMCAKVQRTLNPEKQSHDAHRSNHVTDLSMILCLERSNSQIFHILQRGLIGLVTRFLQRTNERTEE